jgi:hypothetical protein
MVLRHGQPIHFREIRTTNNTPGIAHEISNDSSFFIDVVPNASECTITTNRRDQLVSDIRVATKDRKIDG